jgi:hypothetical protein
MRAVEAMALVAGHVDEELLKRNEYLAAENEILRSTFQGRLRLHDGERIRRAKLGHELGRKALEGLAAIVKPQNHPGLVPSAGGEEIRQFQAPEPTGTGPAPNARRDRGPHREDGSREPQLGLHVLFFMHVDTRRVHLAGMTLTADERWMKQIGRNLTMEGWGFLQGRRYLILDRDSRFTAAFWAIVADSGTKVLRLPLRSPNLNAYCKRWVL